MRTCAHVNFCRVCCLWAGSVHGQTSKAKEHFSRPVNQPEASLRAPGSSFVLSLVNTPPTPLSCRLVGGVFAHFSVTRRSVKRWRVCENPPPGATKQTAEEMNASVPSPTHLRAHTFTFYPRAPPSSPPSHSARGGHRTDNPKGHLWPPSLATPLFLPLFFPLFSEKKMERWGGGTARGSLGPDPFFPCHN